MASVVLLSLFDNPVWFNAAVLLGEIVIILLLIWVVIALIIGILFAVSIRRQKMFLPSILRPMFTLVSGGVKLICSFCGVDATQLIHFLIDIDNEMNMKEFAKTPVSERVIFLPLCLRNKDCPARLRPEEGIHCTGCGKCGLGAALKVLNEAGYKTYIIPGSTFIKRIVKRDHPKAMIGVGCLMEVKEGLEMGKKINMATIGVLTATDGCVETTMDFDKLMEAASLGLDKPLKYPKA
ncbi:MAG TPA: DUF116 domain-containing protein [Methanocorpusculum sp.]|nr:DUF116 domain-containing protein [Methanocorpusculum sp.]